MADIDYFAFMVCSMMCSVAWCGLLQHGCLLFGVQWNVVFAIEFLVGGSLLVVRCCWWFAIVVGSLLLLVRYCCWFAVVVGSMLVRC